MGNSKEWSDGQEVADEIQAILDAPAKQQETKMIDMTKQYSTAFTSRESPDDLIEVKPKVVVKMWVNIVQQPDGNVFVYTHSDEGLAMIANYGPYDKVLARAVPFIWRES